jgi:hypothetical protein
MLASASATAQVGHFPLDESLLKIRVKQLDEFFARFNGERDVESKLIQADTSLRKNLIISLLDKKMTDKWDDKQKNAALDFIRKVCEKPHFLRFENDDWSAHTLARVSYKGKEHKLQILLKPEKTTEGYLRWTVAGAKADFLDFSPKDSSVFLFPVSNELNFMQLSAASEHQKENIAAFAPQNFRADILNVFFYLIRCGDLKINFIEKIVYEFNHAAGFRFQVSHVERKEFNHGWLITDLQKE